MRITFFFAIGFLVASTVVLIDARSETVHAATASESQQAIQSYNDAYHEEEPVRGFVRLYLRVAGVVWVTAEWIAAIMLYKGYRMLRPLYIGDKRPQ